MHSMENFLKITRANPEKAEKMVEEEEKEKQDGWGANLMEVSGEPPSMRSKRVAEKRVKMGKKKKQVSEQKKVEKTKKKDQNVKSKKKKVHTKKGQRIKNKNNNKQERSSKNKIKLISRVKKLKQKRKKAQGNGRKSKFLGKGEELEDCSSLWAELTNVGLGVASTLKKQVMDIDLVVKVNSLACRQIP